MASIIASTISVLALGISVVTAYLTLFRRGTVRMTQPTVIFFGPDGDLSEDTPAPNKVFLRTLLFATSKRGRIVENMFVRLSRSETRQNFNIWIYGDSSLVRGSGLYVGENGVACNHHFLLPRDGVGFDFHAGKYELEVFAKLAGSNTQLRLFCVRLSITDSLALALRNPRAGVYFDWSPDSQEYHAHVDVKPKQNLPPDLMATLLAIRAPSDDGATEQKKLVDEGSSEKKSPKRTPS